MKKVKKILLNNDIIELLNILKKESNTYIVGGYIRDSLLGIEPKDCDFCTNLSLDKMLNLFSDTNKYSIKIISQELNIVELKYRGEKYEIARLRKDFKYYENRKKFDFKFVDDIMEDLFRRDFTINSIAYDGKEIIFLENSVIEDLKEKRIKFIGNTEKRILEDPLRILRLFRFFSEKSLLEIDEEAIEKITLYKSLIWNLKKEMIQNELIKIIKGNNYLETFKIINSINLFEEKFNIGEFKDTYVERMKNLFMYSNLSLLKELNFSNKILKNIKLQNNL